MIVTPALNGAQNGPSGSFQQLEHAYECGIGVFWLRSIYAMSNEHCLMLQANIICLLLFLVRTAAMIQHPAWVQ